MKRRLAVTKRRGVAWHIMLSARTARVYSQYVTRWTAYRQQHASQALPVAIKGYLGSLSTSQQVGARTALRYELGESAVDWRSIRVSRYHRNVARLQATVLSGAELEQLKHAQQLSTRDRALLWSTTTLRKFEACLLQWQDIDWQRGVLSVWHGKGDKADITLMTPDTAAALKGWHAEQGHPSQGYVFPGRYPGRPMARGTAGNLVQKLMRELGLYKPWRGAHCLRRTLATRYLRKNPGALGELKKLMRHENLATTLLYDFTQPDELAPKLADAMRLEEE